MRERFEPSRGLPCLLRHTSRAPRASLSAAHRPAFLQVNPFEHSLGLAVGKVLKVIVVRRQLNEPLALHVRAHPNVVLRRKNKLVVDYPGNMKSGKKMSKRPRWAREHRKSVSCRVP
eukprot:scaffold104979_cov28-Tisochrysis_lutea.AAC.4